MTSGTLLFLILISVYQDEDDSINEGSCIIDLFPRFPMMYEY